MKELCHGKYVKPNDNILIDFQENIFHSVVIRPATYSCGKTKSRIYNKFFTKSYPQAFNSYTLNKYVNPLHVTVIVF